MCYGRLLLLCVDGASVTAVDPCRCGSLKPASLRVSQASVAACPDALKCRVYGKRHGFGIYTYLDGGRYEGEWVEDRIAGKGKSVYSNGNVYDGEAAAAAAVRAGRALTWLLWELLLLSSGLRY